MADEFEMAQELQQAMNDAAVAENTRKLAPQKHPDFDGEHCLDCGDDVPAERLAWGRIRCVCCQEKEDNRGKFFGGKV